MPKPPGMRDRICEFFLSHPGKQYTFQEILKRFGTSQNNISCHLKALRDDSIHAWLLNPRRGLWELNPKHRTDDLIRGEALAAGQKRVVSTNGFQHGKDTMTPVVLNTEHWRNHMNSILERMRKLDMFAPQDVRCIEDLMATKWPIEGNPLAVT